MNNEEKTPIDDEEFDVQSIVRESGGVLIVRIDVYDKKGVRLAKQPGGRFRVISKNAVIPFVYRAFNSASEAWGWVDAIDGARVLKGVDIDSDFLESAYKSEVTGDGFQGDQILIGKILILERVEENSKKVRYALSATKFKNEFLIVKSDENISVLCGFDRKERAVAMCQQKQATNYSVRSVRKMKWH